MAVFLFNPVGEVGEPIRVGSVFDVIVVGDTRPSVVEMIKDGFWFDDLIYKFGLRAAVGVVV